MLPITIVIRIIAVQLTLNTKRTVKNRVRFFGDIYLRLNIVSGSE